jgi:hypothetical protein
MVDTIGGLPAGWSVRELEDGETIVGIVVFVPRSGAFQGNRLFLKTDGGTVGFDATSRRGHTVLERELERQTVKPGDRVRITRHGFRVTQDGEHTYRDYSVEVVA